MFNFFTSTGPSSYLNLIYDCLLMSYVNIVESMYQKIQKYDFLEKSQKEL